jgi:hypothetical protein
MIQQQGDIGWGLILIFGVISILSSPRFLLLNMVNAGIVPGFVVDACSGLAETAVIPLGI